MKQKARSKDRAFLRLCPPGRVPVRLPGGAALTGATDPTWSYAPVARTRYAAPTQEKISPEVLLLLR
ncbi:hypothetical protein DJ520_26910 [Klebsiella quasipneumoniae]|nr:hypothetical protein DJ520_26910 [Klebsiella quasipneumoniae]